MTSIEPEPDTSELSLLFHRILPYLEKIWAFITQFRFVFVIGILAFLVKVAFIHSTDMWDEGWFTAIASRMAFFDKPPFAFWAGAFLMIIFGRTTFAAKGIVILGGTGLALIVYFLYSHQLENKSAAIIAGLLVALAHFLTFYSRTAYIDSFVVFMSAIVMLVAIRAGDAIFVENNLKKGYFLLFLTFILNIFNILTKAWQGVLTYPAIAVYLFFRYLERHIHLDDLRIIWKDISEQFTFSPKDMKPYQLIQVENLEQSIPIPWIIAVLAGISSFIGAFFTDQLFVSSLILAIGAAIGCYIVFLRASNKQESQLAFDGSITAIVMGYIAGFAGNIVTTLLYSRLEEPIRVLGESLGEEGIFEAGFLADFLSLENITNETLALLSLEIFSAIFGLILTFGVVFFGSGILLDLFNRRSDFLKVVYNALDLIPLALLGGWVGYWFVFIVLRGDFFDREALLITQFGLVIVLFLIPFIIFYPVLKNLLTKHLDLHTYIRSREEIFTFSSHLFFLSIALILIITSFYYFVFWVQYLDINIANGTFPWIVRTPGELSGDPDKPSPVTYTYLFFTYYIGWRFEHATKSGDLPGSLGSAINDYALIVMLPFFIVGLVAFFFSSKRNPALGSALIAWLITVPLVFFPAQFQLNYYYIPLAVPYLAIAAKGIEYIYSNEQWRISVVDNVERLLAGSVFYIEIGLTYFVYPFFSGQFNTFHLFVATIYLVPFTVFTFKVLKTFPGVISTGFAYQFFLDSWIKSDGFETLYNILFQDLIGTILSMDVTWILDVVEHGAPGYDIKSGQRLSSF
jgi:hypothetical protein